MLLTWWSPMKSESRSFKFTRSRKGQTENFRFGRRDTCLWVSLSAKTQKNDLRTLCERTKSDKFFKSGKCINRRNSVKNGPFRPLNHQNSVLLQDLYLKFCRHIYLKRFFDIYSIFYFRKLSPFLNRFFCILLNKTIF